MRSHVEDSPCFSGWHYLTRVPAPSSSPSQAQQGHTVETPPPLVPTAEIAAQRSRGDRKTEGPLESLWILDRKRTLGKIWRTLSELWTLVNDLSALAPELW